MLTSSVLCQDEDRVHPQVYVLVHEYRIEDSLNARSTAEHPHGSRSSSYLPESSFNGIGRPDCLTEIGVGELETGEEIFQIIL